MRLIQKQAISGARGGIAPLPRRLAGIEPLAQPLFYWAPCGHQVNALPTEERIQRGHSVSGPERPLGVRAAAGMGGIGVIDPDWDELVCWLS